MGRFLSRKESNGQLVVNMTTGLPTTTADTARAVEGFNASRTPADTVGLRATAYPSRMGRLTRVFRLPRRHARARAKRLVGMKIGRGARECGTAPLAFFRNAIRPTGIWSAALGCLGALKRAKRVMIQTARLPAYPTGLNLTLSAPSVFKVARAGAKARVVPPIHRVKLDTTNSAGVYDRLFPHNKYTDNGLYYLPMIEIEEKYCEIAAKRLSQEVLALT